MCNLHNEWPSPHTSSLIILLFLPVFICLFSLHSPKRYNGVEFQKMFHLKIDVNKGKKKSEEFFKFSEIVLIRVDYLRYRGQTDGCRGVGGGQGGCHGQRKSKCTNF